jgi:SnoaL-like domain
VGASADRLARPNPAAADIEAVKILKARYFRFVDAKDWAAFRELFAPGARLDFPADAGSFDSVEAFVEYVEPRLADLVTVHHGHMPEVVLAGPDTAAAVFAMEDRLRYPAGHRLVSVHGFGHYHDTFLRTPDGWRIESVRLERLARDVVRAAALAPADIAEIQDLLALYALGLDVQDFDLVVGLFAPDGAFRVHHREFAGHERLRTFFSNAPAGLHLCGRATVTPTARGATVRSQLVFFPADRVPRRMAIYDDEVALAGGRWRFRSRECRFMTPDGRLQPDY